MQNTSSILLFKNKLPQSHHPLLLLPLLPGLLPEPPCEEEDDCGGGDEGGRAEEGGEGEENEGAHTVADGGAGAKGEGPVQKNFMFLKTSILPFPQDFICLDFSSL